MGASPLLRPFVTPKAYSGCRTGQPAGSAPLMQWRLDDESTAASDPGFAGRTASYADDHRRRRSADQARPVEPPQAQGDRKSTRLNSSHSQISYAVFCLKKKKQEHDIMTP